MKPDKVAEELRAICFELEAQRVDKIRYRALAAEKKITYKPATSIPLKKDPTDRLDALETMRLLFPKREVESPVLAGNQGGECDT